MAAAQNIAQWRRIGGAGGQRGNAPNELNQLVSFPNRQKTPLDNLDEFEAIPNQLSPAVGVAAMWLSQHRDEVADPVIPFVMRTFGLGIREAVEALQRGHSLRYGARNAIPEA